MSTRTIAYAGLLAALYAVVGQVVRFLPNPMVPGAIIALNMVVVVIAGILLGPTAGGLVGLIGTAVNGFLTPAGNPFERAAVVPHMIMGIAAGVLGARSAFAGALAVIVGHVLNVLVFVATGLMPATQVTAAVFFSGLLFETVVDVAIVLLAVPLLRPLVRAAPA